MSARTRRPSFARAIAALASMALVPFAIVVAAPNAHAAPSSLTLVIEQIAEIDHPDDSIFSTCWGDYTFTVGFAGTTSTSPEFSIDPPFGTGCIISTPEFIPIGHTVTRNVDTATVGTDLTISVVDNDTFSSDTMDVSPIPGETALHLTVDPATGAFSIVDASGNPSGLSFPGGVSSAFINGNGDPDSFRAGLKISISSPDGTDTDGDGLLDSWETSGFDAKGDGTIDVNLPAMGADPRHKDLFVELDTANSRSLHRPDIEAMKHAFADAPIANPDGTTGIKLWVDTGGAVDPSAREGQALGTCNDGIDNGGDGAADAKDSDCTAVLGNVNPYLDASVEDPGLPNCRNGGDDDGDGLADGNDPDCVVGDNFGGGNAITTSPAICNLNAAFFTAKTANFAAARLPIFRYAISTPGVGSPVSPCGSGGQAEIGGNDFVDHNGDGGTIMHELGHTLTLRHGGFENVNCKPNDVSVMTYFSQFGVGRATGGVIIDYSPPRQSVRGGVRSSALPGTVLDEAALDETVAVDATDPSNRFVFTNGTGKTVWVPLASQPDWDGDGSILTAGTVSANIDTSDATTGNPKACKNTTADEKLRGADEWSQVTLPFRQFGDSASAALNPTIDVEPTLDEIIAFESALTTTDLGVVGSAPHPVGAGTTVPVTATVTNAGANPGDSVVATFTPDPGLTPTNVPAGCITTPTDVRCALGTVPAGASTTVAVPFAIPADAAASVSPVTKHVVIAITQAGTDPQPTNDTSDVALQIIGESDLSVDRFHVDEDDHHGPLHVRVGRPFGLDVDATVASHGPSSPINATVTFSAQGAGVQSQPANAAVRLVVDKSRKVERELVLVCATPGLRTVSLAATIAPSALADRDPVSANNTKAISLAVMCRAHGGDDDDRGRRMSGPQ